MSVWDAFTGQDHALRLLQQDIASQRVAHAYLLTGAAGRVPAAAAGAFAAALVCPSAGCGACDACRRVQAMAHPDVELVEPAGTQLLVDQIREAVRAAWRLPVAGPRRVIVVDEADRMNPNAQNAFLKALEEPPPSTSIVLVAPSADALLDTVRSRCREVVFRSPSPDEIARQLQREGVGEADSCRWSRVAGRLDRARELASDPAARARRQSLVRRALQAVRDPGDSLASAEELAADMKALRETVAERHTEVAAEQAQWLRESKKVVEDRLKREQRRAEQDALEAALDDLQSVGRDLLALGADPDSPVLNDDVRDVLLVRAEQVRAHPARVVECLGALERARRRLRSNANVQLTLEHVFLAVHRGLT
ncbi:MAG TPA: hypothetical protein VNE62_07705 [Actinomycetota bacterium]|nr:hypothetical protein [Actinomycetota bacterium]